jgi:hypothetical protein
MLPIAARTPSDHSGLRWKGVIAAVTSCAPTLSIAASSASSLSRKFA